MVAYFIGARSTTYHRKGTKKVIPVMLGGAHSIVIGESAKDWPKRYIPYVNYVVREKP